MEAEPSETIFPSPINVTPIQGILYVNDSEQLQNIDVTDGDRVFRVKMNWRDHEDFLNESFIEGSVNKTFDKDGALGYILIEISIKNSELIVEYNFYIPEYCTK